MELTTKAEPIFRKFKGLGGFCVGSLQFTVHGFFNEFWAWFIFHTFGEFRLG